jgi:hypothetical protein
MRMLGEYEEIWVYVWMFGEYEDDKWIWRWWVNVKMMDKYEDDG